jgi:DNA polymerase-4
MSPRTILHVDLDAFFCSVEVCLKPELKGAPFVVGGSPRSRGVVASASYEARRYGIRSAMPTAQALRLCPQLIVVPPRHSTYGEVSDQIMERLKAAAPVVEQISVDEAFLDVSDDARPGLQIARVLKSAIVEGFGLPSSWGVAGNKLVAKIATTVGKPDGLVVVPAGQEREFLAPLPVGMLWGVGPKTQAHLAKLGISTIGDLAALPEGTLKAQLGQHGTDLAARARGEDDSPVVDAYEPRSLSGETTYPADVADPRALEQTLLEISEELGSRLRKIQRAASTVRVKIRWPDFSTHTRQKRLSQPTDRDGEIYQAAKVLFHGIWSRGKAVRLLGVGVSDLGPPSRQLELFDRSWDQDRNLLRAVDSIRERYGKESIQRASGLESSAKPNPKSTPDTSRR